MLGRGVSIDSHGSTKMGENNRFSFAKTSFRKLHSELSGFLVGEIASLDYSLSVFVGWGGFPRAPPPSEAEAGFTKRGEGGVLIRGGGGGADASTGPRALETLGTPLTRGQLSIAGCVRDS